MRHNSVTSNIVGGTTKLETKTELNNLNESKNNFIPMNPTAITKDRKVNDQVSVKSVNIEMLTLNYEELELNSGEICKLEVTIDSDNVAYDQVLFMSTSEEKSVNIEMLTLNYEELELNSGEICKLEVTIDSDNVAYDQVLFMSTSEDILEVDKNGIVTAVNQGVAVVLVTVGEKTVACYVVVN